MNMNKLDWMIFGVWFTTLLALCAYALWRMQ